MTDNKLAADVAATFRNVNPRPVSAQETSRPQAAFAPARGEIDGYLAEMKDLHLQDPDEAMAWLSSVSARALELVSRTLDSESRASTRFRVEILIPFRDECRYQYEISSRRFTIQQHEWAVSGGQAT